MGVPCVSDVKSHIDSIKAVRAERVRLVTDLQEKLLKLQTTLLLADQSVVVARKVYDSRVASFFSEIEALVSNGLSKVFGKVYSFKIDYQSSGAKFLLASEDTGGEFTDILNSHGGGVVQLIAFILQVYSMQYTQASPVFLLDEPFAQISEGYKQKLALLIMELCNQFNFQFILVTHDNQLLSYLLDSSNVCNYNVGLVDRSTKVLATS